LKLEWLLTIANATGTNGLTCLPKHGGARDNKFWSPILWLAIETVLSFRDRTPSALTARPSSSSTLNIAIMYNNLWITPNISCSHLNISLSSFQHVGYDLYIFYLLERVTMGKGVTVDPRSKASVDGKMEQSTCSHNLRSTLIDALDGSIDGCWLVTLILNLSPSRIIE
jgi:hypothetical protein